MKDTLDRQAVRSKYNERPSPPTNDPWHEYTAREIDRLLQHEFAVRPPNLHDVLVLVGSGGRTHDIVHKRTMHVDVADRLLVGLDRGVVGDAQSLPLAAASTRAVVCVGSVINYCDAAAVISEAARILKPGGRYILDVESSDSFEFLHTRTFRKDIDLIRTFFNGDREHVWVYSRSYIHRLLRSAGFRVECIVPIHIASSLRLRFSSDPVRASRWSVWDKPLRFLPFVRALACNLVFFCTKSGTTSRIAPKSR